MKLLHLDSSIRGSVSVSRQLSLAVTDAVRARHPSCSVVYHDLDRDSLPHLSSKLLAASATDRREPGTEEGFRAAQSAMDEFLEADLLVIGAPMYNFTVSSQLKSWFDRIAIAGKTFRYTESGAEGLMGSKKAIIVSSRGNIYGEGSPHAAFDHHERWLRTILGFLGIIDVQLIRAEGIALSPQHRDDALLAAQKQVQALRL